MWKRKRVRILLAGLVLGGAAIVGSLSAVTAAPSRCPAVWAPVLCDNGRVYPNQCEADRHRAKNCVPYQEGL